ncbi:hypothetical protein EVAR_28220_1 [Eumeta japonica]|uniref:Uncharacterized protein n=1 Tax=Eumeta variegata TaxID=151549 RepID=A0A4C1VIS4_EUMVA|nr:hypothetical protein EVAR_28220_1 [Eumeta japonica]
MDILFILPLMCTTEICPASKSKRVVYAHAVIIAVDIARGSEHFENSVISPSSGANNEPKVCQYDPGSSISRPCGYFEMNQGQPKRSERENQVCMKFSLLRTVNSRKPSELLGFLELLLHHNTRATIKTRDFLDYTPAKLMSPFLQC